MPRINTPPLAGVLIFGALASALLAGCQATNVGHDGAGYGPQPKAELHASAASSGYGPPPKPVAAQTSYAAPPKPVPQQQSYAPQAPHPAPQKPSYTAPQPHRPPQTQSYPPPQAPHPPVRQSYAQPQPHLVAQKQNCHTVTEYKRMDWGGRLGIVEETRCYGNNGQPYTIPGSAVVMLPPTPPMMAPGD